MSLSNLFWRQKSFQEQYIIKRALPIKVTATLPNFTFSKNKKELIYNEKVRLTKDNILCLIAECIELLRETKWKTWKKKQKKGKRTSIVEEIIDIQHFLINLCLIWGIGPDEFYNEFLKKNKINVERQMKGY